MIEVQEPTEPVATLDRAVVVLGHWFGVDQPVVQPLVMAFGIVVLDKFPIDQPKVLLSQRNDE